MCLHITTTLYVSIHRCESTVHCLITPTTVRFAPTHSRATSSTIYTLYRECEARVRVARTRNNRLTSTIRALLGVMETPTDDHRKKKETLYPRKRRDDDEFASFGNDVAIYYVLVYQRLFLCVSEVTHLLAFLKRMQLLCI